MNSNNYQHITHESIKPFIDNYSSILILGSFPSVKTRDVGFQVVGYHSLTNKLLKKIVKI